MKGSGFVDLTVIVQNFLNNLKILDYKKYLQNNKIMMIYYLVLKFQLADTVHYSIHKILNIDLYLNIFLILIWKFFSFL